MLEEGCHWALRIQKLSCFPYAAFASLLHLRCEISAAAQATLLSPVVTPSPSLRTLTLQSPEPTNCLGHSVSITA